MLKSKCAYSLIQWPDVKIDDIVFAHAAMKKKNAVSVVPFYLLARAICELWSLLNQAEPMINVNSTNTASTSYKRFLYKIQEPEQV